MTTLAALHAAATPSRAPSTTRTQGLVALAVLVAFTTFTLWVMAGHGVLGFLTLAGREPWGLQLVLDLALALTFAIGWMRADARKRGIRAWPWIVAAATCGSPGLLAYVVRRSFVR